MDTTLEKLNKNNPDLYDTLFDLYGIEMAMYTSAFYLRLAINEKLKLLNFEYDKNEDILIWNKILNLSCISHFIK